MHTEKYFILIICFFIWTCSQDDGPEDCLDVAGGSAELDSCGACDDDPANDCTQDCEGIWGG